MKILVPLDGSALAEAALAPALALLGHAAPPRELVLSRVVADTLTIPDVTTADLALEETDQALAYLNAVPVPTEGVTVSCKVGLGHAATVIPLQATEEQADLMVMTTHGRSGAARMVLGSVAEEVVQRAALPMLLVRAEQATYLTRDNTTMRVLAPLDGTAASEAILSTLLAVLPGWPMAVALLTVVPSSASGAALEEARSRLIAVAVRFHDQAPAVDVTCETVVGHPTEVIPPYCQQTSPDVIALTHRHQGLVQQRLPQVGTFAACLAHTTLPILIQPIAALPPRREA